MKFKVGQSIRVVEGFYAEQHFVVVNSLIDKKYDLPMYQLAVFNPKRPAIWMPEYNIKSSTYEEPIFRVPKILKRFKR